MIKDKRYKYCYWNDTKKRWYGMVSIDGIKFTTTHREDIDVVFKEIHELKEKLKDPEFFNTYKVKNIKEFNSYGVVNLNALYFRFSHTGAENQNVYIFKDYIKGRLYYIEMIEYPDKGWAYHAENGKELVCDSRIANKYYDSLDLCKKALIESFIRINYRKLKNKVVY